MSIDARIEKVIVNEDGSGELLLIDRPAKPYPGCRGQNRLRFDSAPEEVTAISGADIWGGAGIMLGDVEIARREGYTRLKFHDSKTLARAIRENAKPSWFGRFRLRIKRAWKWFKARHRLDLIAVCEMSQGRGMVDFHDYPDSEHGEPFHFITMKCKRCGKEFTM